MRPYVWVVLVFVLGACSGKPSPKPVDQDVFHLLEEMEIRASSALKQLTCQPEPEDFCQAAYRRVIRELYINSRELQVLLNDPPSSSD